MDESASRVFVEFLFEAEEPAASKFAERLGNAGLDVPKKYGSSGSKSSEPASETQLLLEAALASLTTAVRKFDDVDRNKVAQLKRHQLLQTGSAMLTAVLSLGTVASLGAQPPWAVALGGATVISSVLGVIASRLQPGDSKFLQEYSAVVQSHETARLLIQQVQIALRTKATGPAAEALIEEARKLVLFLRVKARDWGLPSLSSGETPT